MEFPDLLKYGVTGIYINRRRSLQIYSSNWSTNRIGISLKVLSLGSKVLPMHKMIHMTTSEKIDCT